MIHTRKLKHAGDDFILQQKAAKKGKHIFIIQAGVFLVCCLLIWLSRWTIFAFMGKIWTSISTTISAGTRSIISKSIGTEPKLDAQWNLNIAIFWYGWAWHNWSFLTDAMIVASINPKKWTMAMLSIPRDLYVKKPNWNYGKINSIFESALYQNKKDYDLAAPSILGKLTEITGVPLEYYAFIDFKWFEKFVDWLWWVEINVPEAIVDREYPWENNSYIVFSIWSWTQTLDWATALKYARSRHSTSDYSRSLRQQAIIQAIIDKLTSGKTLLNPSKVKDLYTKATDFIKTNLSTDEILWGIPYAGTLKHKSSWQIAACGNYKWEYAQAWCLLYTPSMDDFGGMSVQLPAWASPSNVSNYAVIKSFVADTVLQTDFLAEQPTVRVLNGINTGENKQRRVVPVAGNVAIDLVEYGFTIFDIWNAPTYQKQTTIVTNGSGWAATIKKLQVLFPFAAVSSTDQIPADWPSVVVTIWDDYTTYKEDKATLPLYLQY